MAREYFLTTPRLGFSHWTENDLPLAISLWGDLEVTRYLSDPLSPEQIQKKLAQEISWMAAHGVQYWPIFLLAGDEFAGCCGLRPYKLEEKIYEFGFHLRPPFWGQGIATETGRAAIAYAFDALRVQGLFAGHHPKNDASRKVLGKLGFHYLQDMIYPPTGKLHPSYLLERPAGAVNR